MDDDVLQTGVKLCHRHVMPNPFLRTDTIKKFATAAPLLNASPFKEKGYIFLFSDSMRDYFHDACHVVGAESLLSKWTRNLKNGIYCSSSFAANAYMLLLGRSVINWKNGKVHHKAGIIYNWKAIENESWVGTHVCSGSVYLCTGISSDIIPRWRTKRDETESTSIFVGTYRL